MADVQALFATSPSAFVAFCAVLGALVGSFLNVVILRLPPILQQRWHDDCRQLLAQPAAAPAAPRLGLVLPPSQCPHCGHRIRPWENIPIVSFLFLRGKCSACGKSISWRYPAVELVSAILAAIVAWHFGFSATAFAALLFTWCFIALTVIDYDHQLLPDNITLPLLWLGLLANTITLFTSLSAAVIGAVAGYLFLWLVYHLFRLVTGKEGMGYGDFKLFAACGAWVGWQQLPLIILLASFVGAVVGGILILGFGRDRARPIPFGPFLCVAGWVALLWGMELTHAYLRYARLL
jgi:leader peptidase (prepilin peptidase)/N-methyltransferase